MNRFNKTGICLILLCYTFSALGQKAIRVPLEKENLRTMNREIEILSDEHKGNVVRANAKDKPGVIWIHGLHFKSGSIEFDVKGKDVLQESFVGIAFHGSNDSTYESVYFRPFNFNAEDSARKAHAVQYMALPDYDWPYLRENFPGKYEAPVNSFIDPNDWFHVKILVSGKLIRVFINMDKTPLLEIAPLKKKLDGKVGFWLGNGSDGAFSNLVITGGFWIRD
ncbi:MAG: hypothetical protein DI535_03955 [Citrobacter freundii]|nr:MAG: hypothetical protein DI535_03955 [Citrobacter freundii]